MKVAFLLLTLLTASSVVLHADPAADAKALAAKAGDQLRGIFSGHLHRAITLFRDGILNSGVSSPACEFTSGPEDTSCEYIAGGPIPFNHLTFTASATMVKSYTLPFPAGS